MHMREYPNVVPKLSPSYGVSGIDDRTRRLKRTIEIEKVKSETTNNRRYIESLEKELRQLLDYTERHSPKASKSTKKSAM